MKIFFNFFVILTLLLICNTTSSAQEFSAPYEPDDNTILLMHFDDNLSMEGIVTGTASVSNNAAIYEQSLTGFANSFRINNAPGSPGQCIIIPPNENFNVGNNWTIEFWVKVGSYGSGISEYPTIFLKDGNGFPAVSMGFDNQGQGFHATITTQDQTEIAFAQNADIDTFLWHHLTLISDSTNNEIIFKVHDQGLNLIYSESKPFPSGNSNVYWANTEVLLGGVSGGSNIQFDGWIDELRISNTARRPELLLPPKQYDTEYFEMYSENEYVEFLDTILTFIDREYLELKSYWERPGLPKLVPENEKVKIYFLSRDQLLSYAGGNLPQWKRSYFNYVDKSFAVSYSDNYDFYGSLNALAKGAIGQLLIKLYFMQRNMNNVPEYFLEGFGLYRGGYRPDRDSIIAAVNELGRLPNIDDIRNIEGINYSKKKDLTVSYIEFQLFNGITYQGIAYNAYQYLWHPYFQPYYLIEENKRMKLHKQTENFDIYSAPQDIQFLDTIAFKLEEKFEYYSTLFEMQPHNRFNIIVFPDAATAIACMDYDSYNGGSGCGGDKLDILSPIHFSGGINEALKTLIPHEFFHVFHNHMVREMSLVYGFHAEGMAEIMAYGDLTANYLQGYSNYFRNGINGFIQAHGREPSLQEIMNDVDGTMSVYTYGHAFYFYMLENHATYIDLKNFFINELDWTVYNSSYEEIEAGYLDFIKGLAGITNVKTNNSEIPLKFNLAQNYPNPFNPTTTINFSIPVVNENVRSLLKVYDLLGNEITTLVDKQLSAGNYEIEFDASNLSSGLYFYKIQSGKFSAVRKMLLLK